MNNDEHALSPPFSQSIKQQHQATNALYRTPPPPPAQPPINKASPSTIVSSSASPPPQVPLRNRSSIHRLQQQQQTQQNQHESPSRPPPPPPNKNAHSAASSPSSNVNIENSTTAAANAARLVYKTVMMGSVQSLNTNNNNSICSNQTSSNELIDQQSTSSASTNQEPQIDLNRNRANLNDIVGTATVNVAQDNQNIISNLLCNNLIINSKGGGSSPNSSSYASSSSKSKVLSTNSSNNLPWNLINGEMVINKDENERSEIIFVMPDDRGIRGKLYITNFRLYFRSDESQSNQFNSNLIIDLPLGLINRIEKIGHQSTKQTNFYGLLINCKNGRRLRFATTQEKGSRKQLYELLQKFAFPLSHNLNFFAYNYKQTFTDSTGYQVYDVKNEYERMGISKSNDWRFSFINQQFKFCDTYPKVLVVPQAVSDEELRQIGEFRSKKRIPVVSWLKYDNRKNHAALLRSSQPLSGITQKRSEKDENYLFKLYKLNTINSLDKLFIVDARPLVNAVANRANGGGYENEDYYRDCEINFLNIHNIHVMRECLRKVFDMAMPSFNYIISANQANAHLTAGYQSATLAISSQSQHQRSISFGGASIMNANNNINNNALGNNNSNLNNDEKNYFLNLENSKWLEHIRSILNGALRIVKYMNDHSASVLVHCSDGWDRTSQLTSLSMLMMDKYYRTIKGFEVLIEKEWISFGHRFGIRMGHGSDKHSDQDRSPIFLQFIDCVWQILQQNSKVFEFNEKPLLSILNNMYTCQFGTFLYNNELEREKNEVRNKTVSFWSYVNSFKNEFRNNAYMEHDGVVELSTSLSSLQLWTTYYFQYKDIIDDSMNESTLSNISSQYQNQPNQANMPQAFTVTPPMPSRLFGQAFLQQVVGQMKKASARNIAPQEPELIRYKACIQQSDITS